MSGFNYSLFFCPPFCAFLWGVAPAGKQIAVEFGVKPVKEPIGIFIIQKNAVKRGVDVLKDSLLLKTVKLFDSQRRISILVLPIEEKLNKDYTRKEIMTYVVIHQSLVGKFFTDVTQICQKHLICATITIEAQGMLDKELA